MQKDLIILGTVNKQEFPDVTVLRLSEAQTWILFECY